MVLQLWNLHTNNRFGASIVLVSRLGITKRIFPWIVLALESTLDVIEAHNSVQNIIETLELVKKEVDGYHAQWYSTAVELAAKVEAVPTKPKTTASLRRRANIPAENEESHFKRNLTIPILDKVCCSIVQT